MNADPSADAFFPTRKLVQAPATSHVRANANSKINLRIFIYYKSINILFRNRSVNSLERHIQAFH